MNREEITNRIQEGFFDLAPDLFDKILEEAEQPTEHVVLNLDAYKKEKAFYQKDSFKMLRRVAVLIVVIGILFGIGIGIFRSNTNQAVYVVTVDVNPSIRLELNEDYCVNQVLGLNEDGKQLIKKMNLKKNRSIQQMLGTITDKLISEGYLRQDGGILVSVLQGEKQDCTELKQIINQELNNDVSKCGVSGVRVEFQTMESKENESGQTGKDILKERLVKEYQLDSQEVDEMNICDMFDYVEKADSSKRLLEKIEVQIESSTQSKKKKKKKTTAVNVETSENISSSSKTTQESRNTNSTVTQAQNTTTAENKTTAKDRQQNEKDSQNTWQNPQTATKQERNPMPNKPTVEEKMPESEKLPTDNRQDALDKWQNTEKMLEQQNPWPSANENVPDKWQQPEQEPSQNWQQPEKDQSQNWQLPDGTNWQEYREQMKQNSNRNFSGWPTQEESEEDNDKFQQKSNSCNFEKKEIERLVDEKTGCEE